MAAGMARRHSERLIQGERSTQGERPNLEEEQS